MTELEFDESIDLQELLRRQAERIDEVEEHLKSLR